MKKLNRKSVSSPLLRRPAPAPYFHPFFNFSDSSPSLPGEVIKIYFLPLFKKGAGGSEPCYMIQKVINISYFLLHCTSNIQIQIFDTHTAKNCIEVFKKQKYSELETSKTCEACSTIHWEGTCRRS